MIDAKTADVSNLATRFVKLLSPRSSSAAGTAGAMTIGRAAENDIVVSDVLASRQHATLIPTPLGTEIRDNSINGTFVNGTRVGSAILTDDDVVTIGNVDLVFRNGTLVQRSEAATRTGGLEVRDVKYVVDNGKQLLDNISLTARPGTLTAVIGGSGAGKSTLARLIAGYTTPSSGSVTFEGHNIHAEYASLRSRIGMVPQDDVVHRQLTVNQALGYAAELRLPPDTSKADRAKVVTQVLEELDLTKHADTRVDKLSGGQRKRASVALELLTGPSLLILDEPTSGLDPALDHQVMMMLRQLADAGRVVIVVTHMLSYLDICDQLLLVAPGGKTAYCGPPDQIGDGDGHHQLGQDLHQGGRRSRRSQPALSGPERGAEAPQNRCRPRTTSRATWANRSTPACGARSRRSPADRSGWWSPTAPTSSSWRCCRSSSGALSLTVPGSQRIPPARPERRHARRIRPDTEPADARRGLHGHRADDPRPGRRTRHLPARASGRFVHHGVPARQDGGLLRLRDRAVGDHHRDRGDRQERADPRSRAAGPRHRRRPRSSCSRRSPRPVWPRPSSGLAISSLVRSSEQIMPLFVVAVMAQLVLCGGMVPVTGRLGLDQLSFAMPARWGYAAAASTVDVRHLVPGSLLPEDRFWQHTLKIWLLDMGMLAALSVLYFGFVRWKIRLRR